MEDGRTYAVTLSQEGRELLDAIKPSVRRADRAVLSCLGDEDGKVAAQILGRLLKRPAAKRTRMPTNSLH